MSDNSRYIADITIPDDSEIEPGDRFIKTWRIENTGDTVWEGGSHLVFIHGTPMTDMLRHPLPEIGPGQQVNISIMQTAPTTPGTYFGDWRLQNPAGEFFGELIFLRIVVPARPQKPDTIAKRIPDSEPDPVVEEETGTAEFPPFDPAAWRDTIWALTSIFESGRPSGHPAAYQTSDAGVISYGKHQATLASGTLGRVLEAYLARSNSITSQALRQEYAARIAQRDESLRHDGRLRELLLQAAGEQAMEEAQDLVFDQNFYQPAIAQAKKFGLQTPLGLACLYDTQIQGGLFILLPRVTERLGGQIGAELGDGRLIDEPLWLATFLDLREERLFRLADQFEERGDSVTANALRISNFRVEELRNLLQAGNLWLRGPFVVRGQQISGISQ